MCMTIKRAEVIDNNSMTLVGVDLDGDTHIFNFHHVSFAAHGMASGILSDLRDGVEPFLCCRYNEARDLYVVVDRFDFEVLLSRFSGWRQA